MNLFVREILFDATFEFVFDVDFEIFKFLLVKKVLILTFSRLQDKIRSAVFQIRRVVMFSIGPMFFKPNFGKIIIISCFLSLIFNFNLLFFLLIPNSGAWMLIVELGVILIRFSSGGIKRLVSLLLFELDVFLEEGVDLLIEEDILSIVFLKQALHF